MDYVELKYLNMVSYKLRNFKQKSNTLINCSCPFCGDSSYKKSRARAYIIEKNGKSVVYCHNCGVTKSIGQLLQFLDETIYSEYIVEKFKDTHIEKKEEYKPIDFSTGVAKRFNNKILGNMKKVSQLAVDHPVKKYIDNRLIPANLHYRLYFCRGFMAFTNTVIPGKFSEEALKYDEPRLLIPFWDKAGNIHAFQGRSFKKNSDLRYVTIVLDETTPKLYGLDKFRSDDYGYVVEGPIDSLFIPNCIATAGGDIAAALNGFDKNKLAIVYDNEKRSNETFHKLDKAINQGYNVCIFPDTVMHKDLNDMIMAGYTTKEVKTLIDNNVYSGLDAQLRLALWSKRN